MQHDLEKDGSDLYFDEKYSFNFDKPSILIDIT